MFGVLLLSVQEVEKDLQIKSDLLNETMRSVEEFLSDRGDSLSSEERAKLQGALSQMKEQHSSLTKSIHSSLAQVDTAIVTTQQQNTQRVSCPHMYMYIYFFSICQHVFFFFTHCHVLLLSKAKAEEQMQETQERIDTLLRELSSLDDSKRRSLCNTVTDTPSSGPQENALNSHSDMLQVRFLNQC